MDLTGPSTSKTDGIKPTTTHCETIERTTTEDDWHTVLTLRQRKQQAREKKQGLRRPEERKPEENPLRTQRKRKGIKYPPFPKDDFKIVIRPHQGLPLRTITTPEMAAAVSSACQHTVTGEHFLLRIKPGSNIVIISTSEQEVAERIRRITTLTLNGRKHAVNVYAATGEEALRGVVHGIPASTPTETLMANLRVRTQGVEIIHARMMGETKSAAITFCGPTLPRFVYYCGGELACHPYRATVQVCKTCYSKGHRTDVCPQPDTRVCRICGTRDPFDGHMCAPKCASCGGEHVTGDRSCTQRLRQPRTPARQPRKRSPSPKGRAIRWFTSEEEESELCNQVKSRSPSRHRTPSPNDRSRVRARSKTPPPPRRGSSSTSRPSPTNNSPKHQAGGSQLPTRPTTEPAGQKSTPPTNTQVSWARVAAPKTTPIIQSEEYQRIIAENKQLKSSLAELQAELAALKQHLATMTQSQNTKNQPTQMRTDTTQYATPAAQHGEGQLRNIETQLKLLFVEIGNLKQYVDDSIKGAKKTRKRGNPSPGGRDPKVLLTTDTETNFESSYDG